jgi:hypothetical protein
MAYEASAFGRGWDGRWCKACQAPIRTGEPVTHVHFDSEPDLSGPYHEPCGRPYQSMARIMNGTIWGGR